MNKIDEGIFRRICLQVISDAKNKGKDSAKVGAHFSDRQMDVWDVELVVKRR